MRVGTQGETKRPIHSTRTYKVKSLTRTVQWVPERSETLSWHPLPVTARNRHTSVSLMGGCLQVNGNSRQGLPLELVTPTPTPDLNRLNHARLGALRFYNVASVVQAPLSSSRKHTKDRDHETGFVAVTNFYQPFRTYGP